MFDILLLLVLVQLYYSTHQCALHHDRCWPIAPSPLPVGYGAFRRFYDNNHILGLLAHR